ncbi:molybdopterin-binding protein [Oricola cellulosilytica]|uniref:Uncharacterized protein n=1 Tax=Oricola cellulosilytica TaxID=1429082 RepID=A0A4R0PDZ4_9HYPH|nr:molybdopterin-binding protein [Oricola cellulosilytica]TCD14559.1 hypothetical protein E0D97_10940 [Oricola cellulosilytica]
MWFGERKLDDSTELAGAILAHSLRLADGRRMKKGHVLTDGDLDALRQAGIVEITVAITGDDDLSEDVGAALIATALQHYSLRRDDVGTGRVNFHAVADGVMVVNQAAIDALNGVDPAVTVATLPNQALVKAGQMVATVKIIPFAISRFVAEGAAAKVAAPNLMVVHPLRDGLRVSLVQTRVAGTRESVLDKTVRVTGGRLSELHAVLASETRVDHTVGAVAEVLKRDVHGSDLVLVFGASAVTDRGDVVPRAIELAGGTVRHLGMPVDPGNLLVLAEIGGKPVIGAPGCARSPKENGFDWVLQRLCAGLDVDSSDIVAMGVGGLLTEIPLRPHPRETRKRPVVE